MLTTKTIGKKLSKMEVMEIRTGSYVKPHFIWDMYF